MRLPSLALAAALSLALPQAVLARPQLAGSSPAANATVKAQSRIELRFNEPIAGSSARAEGVMTGMPGMADHPPMPITGFTAQLGKDGKSLVLLLRRPLPVGSYRVNWSAIGADKQRANGSFNFTTR